MTGLLTAQWLDLKREHPKSEHCERQDVKFAIPDELGLYLDLGVFLPHCSAGQNMLRFKGAENLIPPLMGDGETESQSTWQGGYDSGHSWK